MGSGSPSSWKCLGSPGCGGTDIPICRVDRCRQAEAGLDLQTAWLALLYKESLPSTPHPLPWTWHVGTDWTLGTQDRAARQLPPTCLLPFLINSAAAMLFPFAKIGSGHPGVRQPQRVEVKGATSLALPLIRAASPLQNLRSLGSCWLVERQSPGSGICMVVKRELSQHRLGLASPRTCQWAGRRADVSIPGRPGRQPRGRGRVGEGEGRAGAPLRLTGAL